MALNYSHRPVFSAHISEDNLVSPMRIANGYFVEGLSEKKGEGCSRPWYSNQGETDEWHFNCRRERVDRCCSSESKSKDIIDLLPSDPFEMDIKSTVTAFTGWLEDLEVDYGEYARSNNVRKSRESYDLFADWNLFWDNALNFPPFSIGLPSGFNFDEKFDVASKVEQYGEKVEGAAKSEQVPHEALILSLSYLGVKDLLSVEKVCKSLCCTVREDPLLWISIHIDQPLNERITDDLLLQLASRAQGNLQCLSLVECPKVTDDGIRRVLETNPRLYKLFVPGCTRLTIEGILTNIKAHNCNKDVQGIKQLRVGGLYGVTQEHFQELNFLLGIDTHKLESLHKPHFYHRGNFYLPYDDDRAIDIEMCPKCEKLRLVYDCPSESCRVKDKQSCSTQVCRACTICIPRCAQCGRCVKDNEYVETFCLDLLCSECFEVSLKYVDKKVDPCGHA